MTNELIPNSDMQVFSPADISRARLILNQPALDEASAIKALIIQRDTGLSMARGEVSIVPFNGRPQVMINKQGYLAYASRQDDYDGYESGVETVDGEVIAWCKVYNKSRSHPVSVKIYQKEYAKSTPIWKEKPRYMLEKTAISLALRAAFPILNGTYTDDEIEADAPVRIEPKSTDIKVEVKPYVPPMTTMQTPAPKKEPVTNYTCNTITTEEVNLRYLPVFQSQHLDLSVFADADLGNGKYNKDLIEEDYRRQQGIKKQEPPQAPAPTSAPKQEPKQEPQPEPQPTENPQAEAERKAALTNLLNAAKKMEASKQTKPTKELETPAAETPAPKTSAPKTPTPAPTPAQSKSSIKLSSYTCEVCGCKLTEFDANTCNLFTNGHMLCETHRIEFLRNKAGGSQ